MKILLAALLLFSTGNADASGSLGFIVKLKSLQDISRLRPRLGKVKAVIPQLNIVVVRDRPSLIDPQDQDKIEYIEPNGEVRIVDSIVHGSDAAPASSAGTVEDAQLLWGMHRISAPEAWLTSTGSREAVVAISDTGAWPHAELVPNFWANAGEIGVDANGKSKSTNRVDDDGNGHVDDLIGWNFETNSNDPRDFHYHGTHVAGTVGAIGGNKQGVAGVVWNTSLMITKFLGHDGSGTDAGGAATIVYAADNGAKAINCSWGSYEPSKAIQDAIAYAESKGMLVVAAAGNDGEDHAKMPLYPAAYPHENLISVASINRAKVPELSWFSSYNATSVDIAAPGEEILSTFNPLQSPVRPSLYYELSGTSMATPHVTGVIAMLYSVNPSLTWREAKDIILTSATPSPKLAGKILTGGYLNAAEAVKKAKQLTVRGIQ